MFNNVTLRMNGRLSLGGKRLRVRLSNAHGIQPLTIGAAHIGLRAGGPAIVPESDRVLTFGGERSAVIATGSPADQRSGGTGGAPARRRGDHRASARRPANKLRHHRSLRSADKLHLAAGQLCRGGGDAVGKITDDWYFVSGIDVLAEPGTGAVVALGDSLTDGNISTHDAHANWPSQLARRLVVRPGGRPMAVMNQGLGGNRICTTSAATAGCVVSIATSWRRPA